MVSRVKVKICDVRTPEIARVCAEVGVDYIGIHQIQGAFQPEKLDILQKIRQAAGQVKLVLVTKEDN